MAGGADMSEENLPAIVADEPEHPAIWDRITDVRALRAEIRRLERELHRAKRLQIDPAQKL